MFEYAGAGHGDRDQPPAQGRRPASNSPVAGRRRRSTAHRPRADGRRRARVRPDGRRPPRRRRCTARRAAAGHDRAPRVALYSPWTGGNIDEGWTRWVLEQYEFALHDHPQRRRSARRPAPAVRRADHLPTSRRAKSSTATRPRPCVPNTAAASATPGSSDHRASSPKAARSITLGAASDLAIDRLPIPVRNLKRALRREQHFAPGTILESRSTPTQPLGLRAWRPTPTAFYKNSPFFAAIEGFTLDKPTVIARYPGGQRRRLRLAAGRGADGGPRRGRLGRHEPRPRRAVRAPAAAPRPDPRHLPAAVQRALPRRPPTPAARGRPTSK